MDMISKSIKGVVEQGVRSATAWDNYAFGDLTRSVVGAGTVQQQWEALVLAPVMPLDNLPFDACRGTVLVVGGGPVALWTAIQLRLLLPTQDVLVVEKRAGYSRHHVIKLDPAALHTPLADRSAVLRKMLASVPPTIAIADLERQLAALASLLGIRVAYEREYPSVDVQDVVAIVGADGAHSTVRRLHFNNALQTYDGTMYAVELRYDAQHAAPLSGVQQYALIKAAGRLVSEHVSHGTRISVRFVVSGAEYVAFSGATAAAPWTFAQAADMPPAVLRAMQLWIGARAHYTGEVRFATSECISSVSLAPYRSVCFSRAGTPKRAPVFLVGDAAFGVPFFRALNNGLRCGTALAHVLARLLGEGIDTTTAYESYVSLLADTEIESVRARRGMMDIAAAWCNVSARVPWEMLAIPPSLIESWEAADL